MERRRERVVLVMGVGGLEREMEKLRRGIIRLME